METLFSSISRIWQPTWTSFKCSAPLHGKRWLALREERKHNMKVFSKKNLTKLKRVNKNTANSQPLGVDHLACFSFLSLLLPASWLLHCSLVPLGDRMCVEGQIGEGRDHQSILHLASHSTERLGWNREKTMRIRDYLWLSKTIVPPLLWKLSSGLQAHSDLFITKKVNSLSVPI